MKRMTLIAVALCLLVLTTVGVGVVVAKQETSQKGSSSVYQFDVPYATATPGGPPYDGQVVGKLVVDLKTKTYTLNAHGLAPGSTYYLNALGRGSLGSATANKKGDLHLKDEWQWNFPDVTAQPGPTFHLSLNALAAGPYDLHATQLTAHAYTTLLWTNIHGKLTGQTDSGTWIPLPGQRVEYSFYSDAKHRWVVWADTTDSHGDYSITKAFASQARKYGVAEFKGGWYDGLLYATAQCNPDWPI